MRLVLQCGSGSPGAWSLKDDSWRPSHARWDSRGLPYPPYLSWLLSLPPSSTQAWAASSQKCSSNHTDSWRTPPPGSPPSQRPLAHTVHIIWPGNLYLSYEVFKSFSYLNMSTMCKVVFSVLLPTLSHSILMIIILSGRDYSYSHFAE